MLVYCLIIALIFVAVYLLQVFIYRKTTYFHVTHNPLFKVLIDTGLYGEYLTYKKLRSYEKKGAKLLFNVYLPREDDKTTEIDVMMIYQSGIYVFESKNYSGWIFGSEFSKTWTQSLPSGKKSHKEHFLNPIMQNKLHIKWLINQIGDTYPIHSIIVFSKRCTLKKIELKSDNIFVIKRDDVKYVVKKLDKQYEAKLTQAQIDELYDKLYPNTQVSQEVKEKHIQDIKEAHAEEEQEKRITKKN